jgi:hypothetical protein
VIESINIYCPNFERSIRILQDAGFQGDSRPRRGQMKKIMPGLRMSLEAMLRAVLMIFGDNPCSTLIDLKTKSIQFWTEPILIKTEQQ